MRDILIVDDDAQNVYMLQALLSGHGYGVATAANGAEALDRAHQEPPDMIVADILMPVMDGFELCRRWKADPVLRDVPFVFYTATYTDARDEEFALSLGAERFVVKPQEPQDLVEILKQVHQEHRHGEPTAPAEPGPDEPAYFRQYNEVLIRKLEQKMVQLEAEVVARREVEAGLRASEERHRRLFETMLQGVIYHDRDGRITNANPAAERILGLTASEMIGWTSDAPKWRTLGQDGSDIPPEEHPAAVALRTGRAVENVVMGVVDPRDGVTRWIRIDAVPLFGPDDNVPLQVYTIFDDITERRRVEAERELSARCLQVLNGSGDSDAALLQVLLAIKGFAEVEAVGLRLCEGEDFPYRETSGFSEEFLERASSRCSLCRNGRLGPDATGTCPLECDCATVVRGRADAAHPLFTEGGSFWANSIAAVSASCVAGRPEPESRSCFHEFGYESVALVPVRSGAETLGLLQLCDRRRDRLNLRLVRFLEGLGNTLGIALARKRAEDALRESEELYRRVVQDQTEMICRCLPDGTITFVNSAWCGFFRLSEAELIGANVYALIREENRPRLAEAIAELSPSQPTVIMDIPYLFPEERSGWTRWTHRGFFDELGSLAELQATGSDITALKRAEGEHRLAAVGQLAAGVAHDFNNLLQGMSGTAELVELGHADTQRLVDIVLRSTRSGSEITRNLMAFARPEEPRRETGHLERSLEAALAVAGRQLSNAEIRVVRQYASPSRTVVFDAAQIEQVFLNLIINASHAMPGGGTLTVGTQYLSPDTGRGQVVIWVADTGTGIAPEHLDRIFEPFFTTKGSLGESETPGSGLGLSVSHGFVAAHGGSISVSSDVGVGTRFEIRLPLGEEPAPPAEAAHDAAVAPQDMARLGGTRILVVEDEPDVLDLLQQLFGEAGCQLTAAANVGEAIDALRRREFDLVLSDLMVPGGGGRALAEFCQRMGDAAPPLVVMSGRLERSLHDEVIALGAARTVEKPFALSKLLRTLSEVLQSRGR